VKIERREVERWCDEIQAEGEKEKDDQEKAMKKAKKGKEQEREKEEKSRKKERKQKAKEKERQKEEETQKKERKQKAKEKQTETVNISPISVMSPLSPSPASFPFISPYACLFYADGVCS
jgi:hypothetical protein